jgi:heme-degrading monooxygenase HmoA/catechol 2,3-dioxygenase-like lactoylglutathione lyase family enzyme
MVELAAQQPGFLGIETVRGADGFGITVSYWRSLDAISAWKRETEHRAAQKAGQDLWYSDYQIRISHVQRAYAKVRAAEQITPADLPEPGGPAPAERLPAAPAAADSSVPNR